MKKVIAMFILLIGITVNAQQTVQKSFIEVRTEAKQEVTPDEIYLNISLRESDSKGRISIEKQEQELKKALTSLGVNIKNDLTVSNANSYYYQKIFKKDTYASKNFQLKVKDAKQLSNVFKKLDDLKVSSASIARLEYSKKEELLKELRIKAVKEAKDRATYMLAAAGETVGKPLEIHDNSYYNAVEFNQPRVMYAMKAESDNAVGAAPMPDLNFKKIKLRATVNAKFEIK